MKSKEKARQIVANIKLYLRIAAVYGFIYYIEIKKAISAGIERAGEWEITARFTIRRRFGRIAYRLKRSKFCRVWHSGVKIKIGARETKREKIARLDETVAALRIQTEKIKAENDLLKGINNTGYGGGVGMIIRATDRTVEKLRMSAQIGGEPIEYTKRAIGRMFADELDKYIDYDVQNGADGITKILIAEIVVLKK